MKVTFSVEKPNDEIRIEVMLLDIIGCGSHNVCETRVIGVTDREVWFVYEGAPEGVLEALGQLSSYWTADLRAVS